MRRPSRELERTKDLMAALLRQPPKPHEEMKVGKSKRKGAKNPARKRVRGASSKPKTA